MKPKEEGGVVDKDLNIYGTDYLKIAVSNLSKVDLSIYPMIVGANTYTIALLIGEKATTIIANELGISNTESSPHIHVMYTLSIIILSTHYMRSNNILPGHDFLSKFLT